MGALAGLLAAGSRSDDPLERMRSAAETLRERAGRPGGRDRRGRRAAAGPGVGGARAAPRHLRHGLRRRDGAHRRAPAGRRRLAVEGHRRAAARARRAGRARDARRSSSRRSAARSSSGRCGGCTTAAAATCCTYGSSARRAASGGARRARRTVGRARAAADQPLARRAGGGPDEDLAAEERRAIELVALGEPLRLDEAEELAGLGALAGAEAARDDRHRLARRRRHRAAVAPDVRRGRPRLDAGDARPRAAHAARRPGAGARPVRPDDALRIARWLLDAGEPVPPQLLLDAAGAANAAGDADLGARLAEQAVADGAGVRGALLLARAHGGREALRGGGGGARLARGADRGRRARDRLPRGARVPPALGPEPPGRAPGAARARGAWWPGPEWQRRLDLLRVHVTVLTGRRRGDGGGVGADARRPRPRRRAAPPDGARAREQPVRQRARPRRLGAGVRDPSAGAAAPPERRGRARGLAPHRDGAGIGWDVLLRELPGMFAQAIAADDDAAAGHAAFALGNLTLRQGRFRDAIRWLTEAELHLAVADVLDVRPIALATRARAVAETGDVEGRGPLEALESGARGRRPLPARRAHLVQAYAWVRVPRGRPCARAGAYQFAAAETTAQPPVAAMLLFDSLRVGGSLEAPGRAAAGAERPLRRAAGPRLRRACGGLRAPATVVRCSRSPTPTSGSAPLLYAMVSAAHAAAASCARAARTPPAAPRRAPELALPAGPGRPTAVGARAGRRRGRAHPARGAAGRARRARTHERRDRRPARALGAHRGVPRLPRDAQARRQRPPQLPTTQ